jgi:hypothetical protein
VQLLRDVSEAPQLPFSYPGAMLLAALPPLHFKVMHARLDAYEAARKQPNDMAMAAPAP